MAEVKKHKQTIRKRRFTSLFIIFGLWWGFFSAILPLLYGQPTKGWIFDIIFFPIYLTGLIFNALVSIFWPRILDEPSIGGYLLGFALLIICSFFIGWVIGITVDGLIAFFKPMENNDE